MATKISVNNDSSNDLLPDGTKPLTRSMLVSISVVFWVSLKTNFVTSAPAIIPNNELEIDSFKTAATFLEVNNSMQTAIVSSLHPAGSDHYRRLP